MTVVRSGIRKPIVAKNLTVGDICEFGVGLVPADMRLVTINDLLVVNHAITGSDEPLPRELDASSESMVQADNMVFYGTQVFDGSAVGLVVATGNNYFCFVYLIFLLIRISFSFTFLGNRTALIRILKEAEETSARKKSVSGGPKASKSLLQGLRKKGITIKEPGSGTPHHNTPQHTRKSLLLTLL